MNAEAFAQFEEEVALGDPDPDALQLQRRRPPSLPIEVLGAKWGDWVEHAAEAAASPVDYVVSPLLASASALTGNARWAAANDGWCEPPHLWLCSVGDSGTGKSPAADVLLRDVLPELERRMLGDFPDRLADWRKADELRKAIAEQWKADVRTAQKQGLPPPSPPTELSGPEPQAPRLRQSDVTIEKLATILATCPKGVLVTRDELAGWVASMSAYNEAGRSFWVEAYGGRPYRVERQKLPEPISIPRLVVSVFGTTQPDKLAGLAAAPDDGLLSRILWTWPDAVRFRLGKRAPGIEWATEAMDRLRMLELAQDRHGVAVPIRVPLVPEAQDLIETFGQQMQAQQRSSGGLLTSAIGKARGHALRLSLCLEYLWWCGRDGFDPPPTRISETAFTAAAALVEGYFVPMAERVYGDAATSPQDRNATTLARWILKTKPAEVNVRLLQREARLPGLRKADDIRGACNVLVEADWLFPPPPRAKEFKPGSGKAAYVVNPKVWGLTL
jgi:uncharacterized protein DUF3987